LANCVKQRYLVRCRELLGAVPSEPPQAGTVAEWMWLLAGMDVTRCPHCGGALCRHELAPRPQIHPSSPPESDSHHCSVHYWDTS
jgi:hypothetical protein